MRGQACVDDRGQETALHHDANELIVPSRPLARGQLRREGDCFVALSPSSRRPFRSAARSSRRQPGALHALHPGRSRNPCRWRLPDRCKRPGWLRVVAEIRHQPSPGTGRRVRAAAQQHVARLLHAGSRRSVAAMRSISMPVERRDHRRHDHGGGTPTCRQPPQGFQPAHRRRRHAAPSCAPFGISVVTKNATLASLRSAMRARYLDRAAPKPI